MYTYTHTASDTVCSERTENNGNISVRFLRLLFMTIVIITYYNVILMH